MILRRLIYYIFSVSETWLTTGVSSNILQITGYNLLRCDRSFCDPDNGLIKRGGGLALYYANALSCDDKKWAHLNISSLNIEVQVVEFIRHKVRNMVFINVYRPPNGSVQTLTNHLSLILSSIPRLDRKDVVFMGDFNIDLLRKNPDSKKIIRFGELNSLVQLVDLPTRVTATSSSLIDLIFCNVTHVSTSGVLDMCISDHQPIFIVKKMNTKQIKVKTQFTGRTYRFYTPAAMQDLINRNVNVNELVLMRDPEVCWSTLYQSLSTIADKIIPEKQYTVNNDLPAWFTPDLLNLKKDRDYFFKKAKISGEQGDWFIARNLRNRTNIAIRSPKAEYIKDKLNQNRDNPKKFWKLIHSEILPDATKPIFNFVNPDTETLHQQDEIPDLINNYFSQIGSKLASEIPKSDDGYTISGHRNLNQFELSEFTLPDVLNYIKNISIYKSSGIKKLSTRFFKDVMLYIPEVFVHMYNSVRLSGVFPDPWKIATVIPLPKTNDPKSPSELRPISLLPIVGKIMEKLIHKQLSTFLEDTNYLTNMQHGFRGLHSTTSATSNFLDDIMLNLDKGYHTTAVFLDIKKAFDTIDHKILLNKIKHAGVGGITERLLANYLCNRKQSVLYNGIFSEIKILKTGVPQGSTLGPLLFLLYINDLPYVLKNTSCLMFADDTVLYHSHPSSVDLNHEIQTDLDSVSKWCLKNYITLNITKSQYVQFGYRNNIEPNLQLKLGNVILEKVSSYKYLGTIIDDKLSGDAQYSKVLQILSGKKITFSKMKIFNGHSDCNSNV